jgi:hypothetical protein
MLSVPEGTRATLIGLGIQNRARKGVSNAGDLTVRNSTLSESNCGSIFNVGTVTVVDSLVTRDAGLFNTGTMIVRNTTFLNNFGQHFGCAPFLGGAIYNGGLALISHSTFTQNAHDQGNGGAIGNTGTMIIRHSSFHDGLANRGGAIYNEGELVIIGAEMSGGHASVGGGIYNNLINSPVTENTASLNAGGIFSCCGGELTLIHTSVTNNTPNDVVESPTIE